MPTSRSVSVTFSPSKKIALELPTPNFTVSPSSVLMLKLFIKVSTLEIMPRIYSKSIVSKILRIITAICARVTVSFGPNLLSPMPFIMPSSVA